MAADKQKNKVNKELQALSKKLHKGIPAMEVIGILKTNGYDTSGMEGMYIGESGKVHEQVSKNRWILFTWHKMSSGKYEINAYVS